MSERATNKALMAQIPEQDPWRIESRGTGLGIPDIWCGDCSIESKCLAKYPKKINTPVCLQHKLTMAQYRRANIRWRSGFKSFVVLQANRQEWYLFAAPDAFCLVDKHELPLLRLRMHALWFSVSGISADCAPPNMDNRFQINDWLKMPYTELERYRDESGLMERAQDI